MEQSVKNLSETEKRPVMYGWGDSNDENLASSLNVFMTALSSMGMFHQNRTTTEAHNMQNDTAKISKVKRFAHLCYCILIVTILLFTFVRTTVSVFVGEFATEIRSARILAVGWTFHCLLNVVLSLSWSLRRNGITAFIKQWTIEQQQAFRAIGIHINVHQLKRKTILFVALSALVVSLNFVGLSILTFTDIEVIFRHVIIGPFESTNISKVCLIVLLAVNCYAWIFPMFFFVLLCSFVKDEAELFNDKVKELLNVKLGKIGSDLLRLRRAHTELCKTVFALDTCFRLAILIWMFTNVSIGCYISYILAKTQLNAFGISLNVFWLSANLIGLGIVSTYAALVHDEMHSTLNHLYDIDMSLITQDQMAQLTLFLSRLTGPPIGITAMGIITITKELLLTIAGLYVTYFFLLLQF